MVGIGGTGMCGIAEVLLDHGYTVTGSDMNSSSTTDRLIGLGAEVSIGHDPTLVKGADVVVISSAVSVDNVEVVAAPRTKNTRDQTCRDVGRTDAAVFRRVAVAGTHGKTTTSSRWSGLYWNMPVSIRL